MSDFEPTSGYSKNRTSTVFENSDGDSQRGEFTFGLSDDWSVEQFDAEKTSVLATNGTDEQRAVVVWNLNGEGGSGGTTNYNQLSNKPQVNGITLSGNKTDTDLHLLGSYTEIPTASAELSGKIIHFAGEGGSTPSSATVSSDHTDWYKYLTIDKTKFENAYNPTGDVVVEFLSHNDEGVVTWTLDDVEVDIAEYGIEYDDESLPASGIKIFVDYKAGTTNYVNGYFYKCTAQGTTPETYAWTQTNVQPAGGSAAVQSVNGKTGVVVLDGEDISAEVDGSSDTIQGHLQALSDDKITTPSGGTAGQVLTKTAAGEAWADVSGGADKNVITLTGESGTLTAEQITQVLDDTAVLEIVCDGEVFRLSNKDSTLTYRTYINTNCEASENVSFKVIYVQLNSEAVNYGAWTLEEVSAGGASVVQISVTGTTTVEGYSVPNPTDEEVTAIYNAVVAGNSVQIVDVNDVYYQVLQADSVDGAINVELLYFGELSLLYTLENDTVTVTGKKIGGAEIDDSSTALNKVWSASKLNTMVGNVESLLANI